MRFPIEVKSLTGLVLSGLILLTPTGALSEPDELITGMVIQKGYSKHLETFGATLPPIGHVEFCKRYRCTHTDAYSTNSLFKLTTEKFAELKTVNSAVNRKVRPTLDKDQYQKDEYWEYPNKTWRGDCEDYVLLKQWLLVELGWPPSSLRITVVLDGNGDGHAVLVVRTIAGDLVLDNQRDMILKWYLTGYKFIKWQSDQDPRLWVSLVRPETNQAKAATRQSAGP